MTQKNDIVEYMSKTLNQQATLEELYEVFPFPRPSIRRVMGLNTRQRTTKKGRVIEPIFVRDDIGIYTLLSIYFKIAQTKTGKYHGERQSHGEPEIRIDATITGWIRKDKINFKTDRIDSSVRENLNKLFIAEIIDLITDYDSDLIDAMESDNTSFEIEGDEIRFNDFDYVQPSYDTSWTIENIDIEIGEWSYSITNEDVTIQESELY